MVLAREVYAMGMRNPAGIEIDAKMAKLFGQLTTKLTV
jgi:glucose/arabinose dehydrogenase